MWTNRAGICGLPLQNVKLTHTHTHTQIDPEYNIHTSVRNLHTKWTTILPLNGLHNTAEE